MTPGTAAKKRGDQTRTRMLEAGVEPFARFGPDGISTRELAKMVGVNSAAIAYHFGGKENYYCEVVRYIIETRTCPIFDIVKKTMDELKRVGGDRKAAGRLLVGLVSSLIETVTLNSRTRVVPGIFAREQLHPTKAFDIIYKEAILKMETALSELIAAATGSKPGAPEVIVKAHALIGQVMVFNVGADILRIRLGRSVMGKKESAFVAGVAAEMTASFVGIETGSKKRGTL